MSYVTEDFIEELSNYAKSVLHHWAAGNPGHYGVLASQEKAISTLKKEMEKAKEQGNKQKYNDLKKRLENVKILHNVTKKKYGQ